MTLEDFVSSYLYPGEFVEIAGLGPSDDSNPIRYSGPLEEIPKNSRNDCCIRIRWVYASHRMRTLKAKQY